MDNDRIVMVTSVRADGTSDATQHAIIFSLHCRDLH